jgi:hypothetical protein
VSDERTADIPPGAILITREQATRVLQVSPEMLDEWSRLPGFPIIRRGHFTRIHLGALQEWAADFARSGGHAVPAHDLPPPHVPRRLRVPPGQGLTRTR